MAPRLLELRPRPRRSALPRRTWTGAGLQEEANRRRFGSLLCASQGAFPDRSAIAARTLRRAAGPVSRWQRSPVRWCHTRSSRLTAPPPPREARHFGRGLEGLIEESGCCYRRRRFSALSLADLRVPAGSCLPSDAARGLPRVRHARAKALRARACGEFPLSRASKIRLARGVTAPSLYFGTNCCYRPTRWLPVCVTRQRLMLVTSNASGHEKQERSALQPRVGREEKCVTKLEPTGTRACHSLCGACRRRRPARGKCG